MARLTLLFACILLLAAGYDRSDWRHWSDSDGDCQNTRAEILIDSSEIPVGMTANHCRVLSGRWLDPYSGRTITAARDLDVDHVIALGEAHLARADWTREERKRYANDPANLLAVAAGENRSKGAKAPPDWMPSDASYHCAYLRLRREIADAYRLRPSWREAEYVIGFLLAHCEHEGG